MTEWFRKLVNYETVSYFITGVLTTAVDYLVFALVNETMKRHGVLVPDPVMTATAVSWVAAVTFAYITNKLAVFKNYDFRPGYLLKEAAGFAGARVLSGLIVMVFMWLTVNQMGWNEHLAKILSSAFNLVFNYVASKFFIFKK